MNKKQIVPILANKKCLYHILCAIDFYIKKGKTVITIADVQNFIEGYTFKDLCDNACSLISNGYVSGKYNSSLRNVEMYGITEKGQAYFDEL